MPLDHLPLIYLIIAVGMLSFTVFFMPSSVTMVTDRALPLILGVTELFRVIGGKLKLPLSCMFPAYILESNLHRYHDFSFDNTIFSSDSIISYSDNILFASDSITQQVLQ
jgi:hypothetical protein